MTTNHELTSFRQHPLIISRLCNSEVQEGWWVSLLKASLEQEHGQGSYLGALKGTTTRLIDSLQLCDLSPCFLLLAGYQHNCSQQLEATLRSLSPLGPSQSPQRGTPRPFVSNVFDLPSCDQPEKTLCSQRIWDHFSPIPITSLFSGQLMSNLNYICQFPFAVQSNIAPGVTPGGSGSGSTLEFYPTNWQWCLWQKPPIGNFVCQSKQKWAIVHRHGDQKREAYKR